MSRPCPAMSKTWDLKNDHKPPTNYIYNLWRLLIFFLLFFFLWPYWSFLRSHVFCIAQASSLYAMNRNEVPLSRRTPSSWYTGTSPSKSLADSNSPTNSDFKDFFKLQYLRKWLVQFDNSDTIFLHFARQIQWRLLLLDTFANWKTNDRRVFLKYFIF